MTKGLVYYTNNSPEEKLFKTCQRQLNRCMEEWHFPIYAISQKPIDFGINIVMDLESSVLSLFTQILKGVQECKTDVILLIEHDLFYHPSHFDFTPALDDHFYFNQNFWNVSSVDGKAVYYIHNDVSMVCAKRELMLKHYTKVVDFITKNGFKHSLGYSPPKALPREERVGHYTTYRSAVPDVNIRHPNAFTRQRMTKDQFRAESSCRDWTESDGVPGWGKTLGRFDEFMNDVYEKGHNLLHE